MKKFNLIFLAAFLVLTGCGIKKKAAESIKDNSPCRTAATGQNFVGACKIRLLAPKSCEEIDLSGGKTYNFVWTSDSTYCQAPFSAYIAGNPYTVAPENNVKTWQFNLGGTIDHYGGSAVLSAQDLSPLSSTDGSYEWTIEDPQHSHPASVVFKVKL